MAGRAFGVRCEAGDNLAIHAAVAQAPAGSVLVVEVAAQPEHGYWGEVLTTAAEAREIAGLVIDAGVRDVAALEAHRFPVFGPLVALRGTSKGRGGVIGASATVGDVEVCTGDWVVGDADGVVVIDAAGIEEVLAAGRARAEREQSLLARLREGATSVELLGLDTASVRDARNKQGGSHL